MDAPGLSLRALEVFHTLVRSGTTIAAAQALNISQSAVSLTISDLEARLGFPLFLRDRRRLEPTEAAHALLAEVEPLFSQLGVIETRAADIRDGAVGRLRIMSTPPLGHSIVPEVLRAFLARRPNVQVQYEVGRLKRVIDAVATGRTEIGLGLGLDDRAAAAVDVQVLRRDSMVALVPEGHALADASAIDPAGMVAHRYIGLERTSPLGQALRAAFDDCGIAYQPQVEVRYCHTAAVLADAGNGLAVVDRYTATFLPGMTLRQIPFEPTCDVSACLVTRRGQPVSQLAREFTAELCKSLQP